jgi:hypothetical protein
MAFNYIITSNNRIKEIEPNEPNSPPSLLSPEKKKKNKISDLNTFRHKKNKTSAPFPLRKSKSNPSLLDNHNFYDIFFNEKNIKKIKINYKKKKNNDEIIDNINIDKERNLNDNIFYEKNITDNSYNALKIYNPDSSRSQNNNIFRNINSNDKKNAYRNTNSSEESESKIHSYNYIRFKNKRIFKKKINQSNCIYNSNVFKIGKKIINGRKNLFDNNITISDYCESQRKINSKMTETLPIKKNSFFYKNTILNNKPYIKKKVINSKNSETLSKKDGNSLLLNDSLRRYSLQTNILHTNKKKPLILNVNLNKKKNKEASLHISQFRRILEGDSIIYILRFFDYYDLINLFKTNNRKMIILINTALAKAYYSNIKKHLLQYNNIIELLKSTIVKSQFKDSLKIDLIINIRFINSKYQYNSSNNKKEKNRNSFIEPLYFQLIYSYNYYPKIKPKKELITKEEYESHKSKKLKMYDNYTFDLYPENYFINNSKSSFQTFISKELPIKEKDNNNIAYVQSILPLLINDKGIINLELYSTDNGFVDPKTIKILMKSYNLKNYISKLYDKELNNMRISEYEELCTHWKNINLYESNIIIIKHVSRLFSPFFIIKYICFENIGLYIFKVSLKAVKSGEINQKKEIGIKIKIKEKNEYIENEIRKNNLLFERRDIFELRVGDELLYYFCTK